MARKSKTTALHIPKRRIDWLVLKVWRVVYRSEAGDEVFVKQLTRPPKSRTFRTSKGKRKFKAVHASTQSQEVIVVAKAKTKKGKKEKPDVMTEEELEELEALEDLDDDDEDEDDEDEEDDEEEEDDEDEEEDEDEDEDEDDDDEEEEEVKPKKSKAKAKGKSKAKTNSKERDTVGTAEVAAAAGVEARDLRTFLRKHPDKYPKDEDTQRYEWSSLNHPKVKAIIKAIKGGAVKDAKKESLDKLKASKAGKKGKKSKGKKKSKK